MPVATSPLVSHLECHNSGRGIISQWRRLIKTENKTCETTPITHDTSHYTLDGTSHDTFCNISLSFDAYTQPLYAQFASYSMLFPLNPNARTFTPTNTFNGAIGAFFAIILILSGIISYVLYIYKQEVSNDLSSKETLKSLKAKNINKIIFGHLNINSGRNKIDGVRYIIGNNIDIFLISEIKLNETFPEGQFLIDGYFPPYRKDRTDKGGVCYSTFLIISHLD